MKKILILALLTACGDNVVLSQPDAASEYQPAAPADPRDPPRYEPPSSCCTFTPDESCRPKPGECITYACPVGPVEFCTPPRCDDGEAPAGARR